MQGTKQLLQKAGILLNSTPTTKRKGTLFEDSQVRVLASVKEAVHVVGKAIFKHRRWTKDTFDHPRTIPTSALFIKQTFASFHGTWGLISPCDPAGKGETPKLTLGQ